MCVKSNKAQKLTIAFLISVTHLCLTATGGIKTEIGTEYIHNLRLKLYTFKIDKFLHWIKHNYN